MTVTVRRILVALLVAGVSGCGAATGLDEGSLVGADGGSLDDAGRVSRWRVETVDRGGYVMGTSASLAVGPDDAVHVAYHEAGEDPALRHAVRRDGEWRVETVDPEGWAGRDTSIAVATDGTVHISYLYNDRHNSFDLRHAVLSGGAWTIETVDSAGETGLFTSMALADDGTPRITYTEAYTLDDHGLRYASAEGGTWSLMTVDETRGGSSIAVDPGGVVHLAYPRDDGIVHATLVDDAWVRELVDPAATHGGFLSLAVDPSGRVGIAYQERAAFDLYYADDRTGDWAIEVIDSEGWSGEGTSLAFDPSGTAHLSWWRDISGELLYATDGGGSWSREVVDSNCGDYIPALSQSTSIAVDGEGAIHIGYWYPRTELRHATDMGTGRRARDCGDAG